MNNAIYNITLDVHSTVSQTMVDVPLGDNARTINILLSDGGIPYEITDDCSAHYSFSMPNGVVHYGDCSIAESVISLDLTNDITGVVGVIEGEITVTDEDEHQLTSPRFTLRISDTLYVAGEVESANSPITLPSNTETAGFLLNPSIYKVTLDLHDTMSKWMLDLKKGDNLRRLDIVLSDDGDPYILGENDSAVLRVKKPDGTILYNYCSVEDDGVISYNFTSQTSAVTGMLECELTIYDSENHKLTSPTFFLRIANTLYSDSEVESQDEFTALTEAISQTNNLDIAVEKENHTATVTITHKDGTESSVEIYDGDPFSGDAWDIDYEAHTQHAISQPNNVGEALDDLNEYLGTMTPSTIGAVPTSRKINGKALSQDISLNASDVGALPSSTVVPDDSTLVHKAGEETITGKKLFTNGAEISRPTSGPILKLSSSAADTNFILERTNGSQCVLESGSSVGLFGTKSNHPLQVRTNYTNRMTIGTDGSVVLATAVASSSDSNQVATTKWVNSKVPTKTSQLVNDSGYLTQEVDPTVIPIPNSDIENLLT